MNERERLVVVTATTDAARFADFAHRLSVTATNRDVPVVVYVQKSQAWYTLRAGVVLRSSTYAGVIPAFATACQMALNAYPTAEVIACLHDDLQMMEESWDDKLLHHFDHHPKCGLAGFGGAWGLGDEQAGKGQYRPTWLVRRGFMSNMKDAEAHGTRVTEPRRVACLDGFSQVFRRQFLRGYTSYRGNPGDQLPTATRVYSDGYTLFDKLQRWGVMHHAYDAATGAFAKQLNWDTWLLPFACHHLGGQTAVGDAGYNEWAREQTPNRGGDQRFWEEAHGIIWAKLGQLLPFEVDRP